MLSPSSIGEVLAATTAGSIDLRDTVRSAIWGDTEALLPEMTCGGGVEGTWATLLGRYPHYAEWQNWKWNCGGVANALGMACRNGGVYFQNSSKLAILHAGHNQPLLTASATADFDALIKALAAEDCDLLLLSMPWQGDNQGYHNYSDPALGSLPQGDYHWQIGTGAVQGNGLTGSRLRYFIDPVIASMERAIACRYNIGVDQSTAIEYERIAMIGHSGGGWATTLAAALDPRITHSYAIAGSVPFGSRRVLNGAVEGFHDWEQIEGIQELGLDYMDLYLMGAAESSRKARLMYNGGDSVFPAGQTGAFADRLRQIVDAGGYGDLQVLADISANGHYISDAHRDFIVSEFC